jgi:hypothetical protein
MGVGAESNVVAPSGCGTTMISRFLHYGDRPRFAIYPNPSEGIVNIASNTTINNVTVEVFNMLGVKCFEQTSSLTAGTAFSINRQLASGIYSVRICAANVQSNSPLVVKR